MEKEIFTGAIIDTPDINDYQWSEIGSNSSPFNWDNEFNIEQVINKKLEAKDQEQTSSCGGFAWSYYGQVLDFLIDKEYQIKSPKFIYAQTKVGSGGSAGRTNCDLVVNQGWGNEEDCPSFLNGTTTEAFISNKADITDKAKENALKDKALVYAQVSSNIDQIAQAIRDNNGCVLGITGQNNGTWLTEFPKPPLSSKNSWNHWVYAGKVKTIDGKKYIGFINSWGDEAGEDGWQWIGEDYMSWIWNVWTLTARPNDTLYQTLRLGSKGEQVKILQSLLGGLTVDGVFGMKTDSAVREFQKNNGLKADGIVGPITRAKLNA